MRHRKKRGLAARMLANLRAGRMQKTLCAATALSAPPLAFEIYLERANRLDGIPCDGYRVDAGRELEHA